jgi:hypothetical protein
MGEEAAHEAMTGHHLAYAYFGVDYLRDTTEMIPPAAQNRCGHLGRSLDYQVDGSKPIRWGPGRSRG